jgi:hypothetical protein
VLVEPDVPIRAAPRPEAELVARLGYRLVFITRPSVGAIERGEGWYGVVTPEGVRGYVQPQMVKDPSDVHVCFGLRNGVWKITEIDAEYPNR